MKIKRSKRSDSRQPVFLERHAPALFSDDLMLRDKATCSLVYMLESTEESDARHALLHDVLREAKHLPAQTASHFFMALWHLTGNKRLFSPEDRFAIWAEAHMSLTLPVSVRRHMKAIDLLVEMDPDGIEPYCSTFLNYSLSRRKPYRYGLALLPLQALHCIGLLEHQNSPEGSVRSAEILFAYASRTCNGKGRAFQENLRRNAHFYFHSILSYFSKNLSETEPFKTLVRSKEMADFSDAYCKRREP